MAKKEAKTEEMLIDIHPENEKEIIKAAKSYKAAQRRRMTAANEEAKLKAELLDFVKVAELKPLADGRIRFKLDGVKITVTPRDMLVSVSGDVDDSE